MSALSTVFLTYWIPVIYLRRAEDMGRRDVFQFDVGDEQERGP